MLISALYQPTRDATKSCDEHAQITDAPAAGDTDAAAELLVSYIGNGKAGLAKRIDRDPLLGLRQDLQMMPRGTGSDPRDRQRQTLPMP